MVKVPCLHIIKKIKISKVRELDYPLIRTRIDELCITNMFFAGDPVVLMKKIVPEFVSNNSELCKLDDSKEVNQDASPSLKIVKS